MTEETTANSATKPLGFNVLDFVDAAELEKDMSFSPNDLTSAMVGQAAMFAHYGVLHAKAQRQVDTVKLLLENAEAAVYKLTRDQMDGKGEKYTEPLLASIVSRHDRVVGMKRALNEAKRVESICKIAVEGFRHRRDMLIQQGLLSREEMKGELKIAERNARDDAMEAQKASVLGKIRGS